MTAPTTAPTPLVQPQKWQYLTFNHGIDQASARALITACGNCASNGVTDLYLLLSTSGGSIQEGFAIYNVLRGLPFNLTIHNVGNVDSVGNVIFLAGKKRYACSNASFMFHGVGLTVENVTLDVPKVKEILQSLEADTNRMASVVVNRAAFPDPATVTNLYSTARTVDAQFALANGLIHEIRDVAIPAGASVVHVAP